jgi:hypothetical protein
MKTKKPLKVKTESPLEKLAKCFLEHAARETAYMRSYSNDCAYLMAHEAGVRRGVFLHAALLAQEASK